MMFTSGAVKASADFTVSGLPALKQATIFFQAIDADGTHSWDFGDGVGTSSIANPFYAYDSIDSFTVIHIQTESGISDTAVLKIGVDSSCLPNGFDFDNGDLAFSNVTASNLITMYGSNSLFTNKFAVFFDTLTIDTTITFFNTPKILMGPGAIIELLNNTTFTLDNCHIKAGCDTMWQGIFLDSVNEVLVVDSSIIEDAVTAINATNNAPFRVQNQSTLNKNLQHISLKNYTNSFGTDSSSGWIRETDFTCTAQLLPPHKDTVLTTECIWLENVQNVSIAVDSAAASTDSMCVFTQFKREAIHCIDFDNLTVIHSRFSNAGVPLSVLALEWIGVFVKNGDSAVVIGGLNSPALACEFDKLTAGVASFSNYLLKVSGSRFSNSGYGVYVVNTEELIQVDSNEFDLCDVASVHVIGNANVTATIIEDNTIQAGPNAIGINVSEATPNSGYAEILSNNITGTYQAILVSFKDRVIISRNIVNFALPYSGPNTSLGILTNNCDDPIIEGNEISDTSQTPHRVGIGLLGGTGAGLCDNLVDSMEYGIRFQGTQVSATVQLNIMQNCDTALSMDNYCVIGPQGSHSIPSDNEWSNNDQDTWMSNNTDGSQSRFWVENATPFIPITNGDDGSGATMFPLLTTGPTPSCQNSASSSQQTSLVQQQIITNQTNNNLAGNLGWQTQKSLIDFIHNEDQIDTSNLVIKSFMDDAASQPVGQLSLVERIIVQAYKGTGAPDNGLLTQAASINASVNDVLSIETYHKQVNEIYLNTWAKGLFEYSKSQFSTLNFIAQLCPHEGGSATQKARVMVSLVDSTQFNDKDCSQSLSAFNKLADAEQQIRKSQELNNSCLIYPNPATNRLNILLAEPHNQILAIELIDALGNKVTLDRSTNYNGWIVMNLDHVNSGMYCLRVYDASKQMHQQRIMIVK